MIHPLSDVQSTHIGAGTNIWQFCVVLPKAVIGKNCNICSHCFIENDVVIGDSVTIKNGVQIWDGITIEDGVFIGANVSFTNDKYPRSKQYPNEFAKTIIQRGASIGAGAIILPGVVIGVGAIIGAGAIVTKNVANYTLIKTQVTTLTRDIRHDSCGKMNCDDNTPRPRKLSFINILNRMRFSII